MNLKEVELRDNEGIHSFELFVNDQRAFIDYETKDGKYYLVHTEVPVQMQGLGVAETLVQKTFEYMEAHGLKLVPLCSYIQAYLKRHPEWNRLLA